MRGFGRAWLRRAVVATRRRRVEAESYLQWHSGTATRVNHAESCDNLSPLGTVPAVAVYQAYQRAQNPLERVHPAENLVAASVA